jgi:hypothetical protein
MFLPRLVNAIVAGIAPAVPVGTGLCRDDNEGTVVSTVGQAVIIAVGIAGIPIPVVVLLVWVSGEGTVVAWIQDAVINIGMIRNSSCSGAVI